MKIMLFVLQMFNIHCILHWENFEVLGFLLWEYKVTSMVCQSYGSEMK